MNITCTGLVETLSQKALAAEEAELEDLAAERDRLSAEYRDAALDLVRSSPLSGWYPITWHVVDHNLPHGPRADQPSMVVVQADEDAPEQDPLRFVVLLGNNPISSTAYEVRIASPAPGASWLDGATPVQGPADVGRWLRERKAASA